MQLLILSLLLAVTSAAYVAPLYKSQDAVPGSYLIKIKDDFEVDITAASIESLTDGRVVSRFRKVLKGLSAELSDKALGLVQRMEAVEYVEEDGLSKIQEIWNLDRIDQTDLPLSGTTFSPSKDGSEVTVYVLDTGINIDHNDIKGRASYGIDTVDNDYVSDDCHGHGSHCAGTVGGTTYGVAKGVNLVAVRVMGCFGYGQSTNIIKGLEWVGENAQKPAVISYSIGGGASQTLDDVFTNLMNQGIIVSVAAGNSDADSCYSSPARHTRVLTVGSTDSQDKRSIWPNGASNYGPCVDLFAPGSDIVSIGRSGSDSTVTMGGTSMACPHVSGAAALILQDNKGFNQDNVKDQILADASVDKISDTKGTDNLLLYVN